MTVRELITRLEKEDPQAMVTILHESDRGMNYNDAPHVLKKDDYGFEPGRVTIE